MREKPLHVMDFPRFENAGNMPFEIHFEYRPAFKIRRIVDFAAEHMGHLRQATAFNVHAAAQHSRRYSRLRPRFESA